MNKSDLIEQIAQAAEISKSAAERAVDALVVAVKTSLKKDEMVTLVGSPTEVVLTAKLAIFASCGTVTLGGTLATDGILLASATDSPPDGAPPLSITVPVVRASPKVWLG